MEYAFKNFENASACPLATSSAQRSELIEPENGKIRLIGFFPGLGSRAAYNKANADFLASEFADVSSIYDQAAQALGFAGHPEKLLFTECNIPARHLEKCGFLGAAFLTYNIALEAHFRALLVQQEIPVDFLAYTGESLGIVAALVASGSLSCHDATKIAYIFEPLVLLRSGTWSESSDFTEQLKSYFPPHATITQDNPPNEPSYVIALKAQPDELAEATAEISRFYSSNDIEVNKIYSNKQKNFYVRASLKQEFWMFMKNFPAVDVSVLKEPTEFLAHSTRMRDIRHAIAHFIRTQGIVFRDPHTPVIPNHRAEMITSASAARHAVLALADQIMESRETAKKIEALQPKLVVEFGLGKKCVELLNENCANIPAAEHIGQSGQSCPLIRALQAIHQVNKDIQTLKGESLSIKEEHFQTITGYLKGAASNSSCGNLLHANLIEILNRELARPFKEAIQNHEKYIEILQQSYRYRDYIAPEKGEVILNARTKKRIVGDESVLGTPYTEITIKDGRNQPRTIEVEDPDNTELVVFQFNHNFEIPLCDLYHNMRLLLRTQPIAREIWNSILHDLHIDCDFLYHTQKHRTVLPANLITVGCMAYKHILFRLLAKYRPAILTQNIVLYSASDRMGWLLALVSTGAAPITDAIQFYIASLRENKKSANWQAALERFNCLLNEASDQIIGPKGELIQSKKGLKAATLYWFQHDPPSCNSVIQLPKLGTSCIVSLGSSLAPNEICPSPHGTRIISIKSPEDIWSRHSNRKLTHCDVASLSNNTRDNRLVLKYAKSRRVPSSTIYSYIAPNEKLIGFGLGGSESVTMFIAKEKTDGE